MDVKPNYGYDKPDFAVVFSTLGAVIICLLILFYFFFRNSASLVFLVFGLILGFSFLVFGMTFVYSKYEKLRERDILQSSIP